MKKHCQINRNMLKTYAALAALTLNAWSMPANAGNGANFVLYNHTMATPGEKELMLMNDIGQEADGTSYTAQMIEFELGITKQWTTEFMIEGQNTSGQGGYNFTGFRWENRYRLFDEGTPLNPVLYIEYEDLSEDTKYIMEMSGREDATGQVKVRPRERVLETRLILSQDLSDTMNVAFNWLNESDLDTGVTAFGYAAGLNYRLRGLSPLLSGTMFGLELFGGLGDSNKGLTADGAITQHYLAPNFRISLSPAWRLKIGGTIGLTNVSQDLFRFTLGREF